MSAPLLEARGLSVHIARRSFPRVVVPAVDGIDLALGEREFVGLVGESGCGKTTLLRALARLVEPTAGAVLHRGRDVTALSGRALLPLRREVQPIFQDAHAALDPRQTVGDAVAEGLRLAGVPRAERPERVPALLARCGLPHDLAALLPHRLSAGQRQRVGIARALAAGPRLLLADEPVASLDPPERARILDLLLALREQGLGLLLVSHDLAVVGAVADRVAVMYLGRLVEVGPAAAVLGAPQHPYTAALVAAAPPARRHAAAAPPGEPPCDPLPGEPPAHHPGGPLPGDPPAPGQAPAGCAFHPGCPRAAARCRAEAPVLRPAEHGTTVACHFVGPGR